MIRSNYYRKGLTVVEILFATSIMLFAIGGIIVIYLMATIAWKEGSALITLQRSASMAMEKMVRGVNGTNGIREANSVILPNANTIRYMSGIDGKVRSYYLSNNGIMYDPDMAIFNDEFFIARKVRINPSGLTFSVSSDGKLVTINLGMQDSVRSINTMKNINVDLCTKVKLRN
jgi:hypothetical protein